MNELLLPAERSRWTRSSWRGRWRATANRTIFAASSKSRYPPVLSFPLDDHMVRARPSAIGSVSCLPFPPPAFSCALFMIQHDCGHGAFFRSRLANDWVGRVISVLTLTPYDCWRRAHAIHHATSGNLDRRGVRRYRHADGVRISVAVSLGSAALSHLPAPDCAVRRRPGLSVLAAATAAGWIHARRLAALGQRDGDKSRDRFWPAPP